MRNKRTEERFSQNTRVREGAKQGAAASRRRTRRSLAKIDSYISQTVHDFVVSGGGTPPLLVARVIPAARVFLALLFLLALPLAAAPGKNILANNPIKNPSYPGFNDAGRRTYLIAGDQAIIVSLSPLQTDIRGLRFTQYPGDGTAIVQASIDAPSASVFFDEIRQSPRITGRDSVRLIRENEIDATGEDWSYDHARQKLNINKNARIIYKAPLKNILGRSDAPAPVPARDAAPQPEARPPDETLITADALELVQNEAANTTIAVLTGNVSVATTDNLRLTCDRLVVTAERLRDKDPALTTLDRFQLLVATGNVRLTQGARTVVCGRADMFPREDRVTLTQSPVLTDAELKITAAGDPITLYRANRRVEGRNGRFTLPPWQAADAKSKDKKAGPKTEPKDTVITAADYVMWETPHGLTHAKLDGNVTVTATDTRLTSDHLELTVTPEKPAAPAPAIPNPKLAPLHRLLATGNVHLAQAGREIRGGQAEVLPHEDRIILTQNPVLTDHGTGSTATADIFTLHQQERRLTAGNNVTLTFPPLKDLSATAARPSAPASPTPDVKTVITGKTLTLWTTPDEIAHAILDHDVRLAATNLDLTCDHLAIDADPNKPDTPAPQSSETSASALPLDPKLQSAASKILSMVATGVVRFKQLAREASCERAEIVPPEDRITLTGKPLIINRSNPAEPVMITGEKMTLIRGQEDISIEKPKIIRAPSTE